MSELESKKRILAADANEEFRRILTASLSEESDLEVVGETGEGTEALCLAERLRPDVVVMDLVLAKADGLEFSYVHIDGANAHELCQYINHNNGILIDGKNNAQVAREIEEMIELYESGIGESVFAVSSRLYHLMALLDDPIKSTRLRKNDDSVSRTMAYIRANVGKKITLHELAQMAGLSDFYFSHLFKEMTGQSPTEFIIYSRIDQAKVLLTTTSLSVGEIAKQVGYAKSSNFILMFQNRVGCSPLQFRKQQLSRR